MHCISDDNVVASAFGNYASSAFIRFQSVQSVLEFQTCWRYYEYRLHLSASASAAISSSAKPLRFCVDIMSLCAALILGWGEFVID